MIVEFQNNEIDEYIRCIEKGMQTEDIIEKLTDIGRGNHRVETIDLLLKALTKLP